MMRAGFNRWSSRSTNTVFRGVLLPVFPLLSPTVLRVLRAKEDVQEEIEELHQEDIAEMEEKELSVLNRLTYKGLRKQIVSVILLMAGQQFTGVNAVRSRLGLA